MSVRNANNTHEGSSEQAAASVRTKQVRIVHLALAWTYSANDFLMLANTSEDHASQARM